jgi:Ring finger domain/PA domain
MPPHAPAGAKYRPPRRTAISTLQSPRAEISARLRPRAGARLVAMRPLTALSVALLALLLTAPAPARALVLQAPAACGGRRVATHASAFFGPQPAASLVSNADMFAPRPTGEVAPPKPALPGAVFRSADIDGVDGAEIEGTAAAPNARSLVPAVRWLPRFLSSVSASAASPSVARAGTAAGAAAAAGVASAARDKNAAAASHQLELSDACEDGYSIGAHGRVVVVQRGRCDFAEKVLRLQRAGAVGVVVVNYAREGERLANMKLNESKVLPEPVFIPAVMISWKDWAVFAPCRDQPVTISFTAEGEATFDIDYGRDALNWAMIRGMALWILCQCGVNVVRYKRRITELRARADAIAALPIETYSRRTSHQQGSSPVATNAIPVTAKASFVTDVTSPAFANCICCSEDSSSVTGTSTPCAHSHHSTHVQHQAEQFQRLLGSPASSSIAASPTSLLTQPLPELDTLRLSRRRDDHESAISDDAFVDDNESERAALIPSPLYARLDANDSTAGIDDDDEPVCAVCLDGFEDGQRVRRLDCTHLYHADCLDPWLAQSSNCCPICKRAVSPTLPPPPAMLHYGSMSV